MRNDGNFENDDEYENGYIDLDQGDDWGKIITEKVISRLKEIYNLSASDVPDISEQLESLKLSKV
jgi:hypothetical protein